MEKGIIRIVLSDSHFKHIPVSGEVDDGVYNRVLLFPDHGAYL